jgi:hypothetical protein
VIARDEQGAMQPTGMYTCDGCKLLFNDINDWRSGTTEPHRAARS